ncbi:MAG: PHP domain-containing protein, partial [Vicinamibacteria bacterium]
MSADFVHLNTHSYYSLMRGIMSPAELLRRVRERGMDTVALTDRNGLYGLVRFLELAREEEVRPIVGAEIANTMQAKNRGQRAVLLAKNREGYENLCRIVTARHQDEEFDLERAILAHAAGLVIMTDDRALLEAGRDLPDRYAELRPAFEPYELHRWARERGIPCVATAGAYFATKEGASRAHPEDYAFHR